MTGVGEWLNRWIVPFLTALSENTYMAAIRTGMVSVVPLTIIGGLFMIVTNLPIPDWEERIAPYLLLLQVPVNATFGLLAVFVCFGIAYDLGKRFNLEALTSGMVATVVFLMIQMDLKEGTLVMAGLGSQGLFTAVLVAVVSARVRSSWWTWGWSSGCRRAFRRWSRNRSCRSRRCWCWWWASG